MHDVFNFLYDALSCEIQGYLLTDFIIITENKHIFICYTLLGYCLQQVCIVFSLLLIHIN